VKEAKESLDNYFRFYNTERLHQSLGYRTPEEVYTDRIINKQKEDEIIRELQQFFPHKVGSVQSFVSGYIYW